MFNLSVIHKLKGLLNDRNLRLLDVVLEGITNEDVTAAAPFWAWMREKLPKADVNHAYFALVKLREILQEYRGK